MRRGLGRRGGFGLLVKVLLDRCLEGAVTIRWLGGQIVKTVRVLLIPVHWGQAVGLLLKLYD